MTGSSRTHRSCGKCGKRRLLKQFKLPNSRICTPCQREKQRRTAKDRRLREMYDITIDEYDLMVEVQGGSCICGGVRKVYDVDHNHKVERETGNVRASVRGALCRSCNKVLAMVRDNPHRLQALAHYLRYPPAQRVLS